MDRKREATLGGSEGQDDWFVQSCLFSSVIPPVASVHPAETETDEIVSVAQWPV